jgi:aspartyl-tRNA(Asn)/glutamyl-tRNA(Gln) amidotransferase subunit A
MEIYDLTAYELADLLGKRKISALEVTGEILKQVHRIDDHVRAYVTLTEEEALAAARESDERRNKGDVLHPLAGIPMGLKDNFCTKGIRTTCCSRMLENFIPPYSAAVADRLKEKGTVLLGKMNMDEFSVGVSTEYSYFYPTRNPWDPTRVPGGSSGGSAAAVAAGEAVFALGSDTGGSIRQPASFCGIVGIKPTYGLVSRNGIAPYTSSLDQAGALTKDVRDCALVLNAIAGHDPLDSTSVPMTVPDYTSFLSGGIKGKKIGVIRETLGEQLDSRIAGVFKKAVEKLKELGAIVEECSFPLAASSIPAYQIIAPAEAGSNLARFDGVRYGYRALPDKGKKYDLAEMYMKTRSEGFGAEVKKRILMGTYFLSSGCYERYYLKAVKVRALIKEDFQRLFRRFDVLVTPTTPTLPFRLGEYAEESFDIYSSDRYTLPVNMAGLPALSLPCGFIEGLPVGMQIMGPAFAEGNILEVAYAFEQNTPYHRQRPAHRGKPALETAKGSEFND